MMRRAVTLLAIVAATQGGNALACSIPVREHQILAAHPPVMAEAGTVTVQIAISEVRIPASLAKTHYPLERDWLGVRGHRIIEGTTKASSELVEVKGRISAACFSPSNSYQVSPDGQLIVWITCQQRLGKLMTLSLTPIGQNHDMDGSVWRSVSWSLNENATTTLPSHPETGMITP